MWHASVSYHGKLSLGRRAYRGAIRLVLSGVGMPGKEWWEDRRDETGVMHLRRRMTVAEQKIAGDPVDIRGTDEELARATEMAPLLGLTPEETLVLG